jgi:RNA polymerase sigma factor (sigma-70 family)
MSPVNKQDFLAEEFEQHRSHLRAVAYRMLGSLSEADDAVQEAWLRLSRSDADEIENLGGWLTTVVARVCLDLLRSRKSRREESLSAPETEPLANRESGSDPEQEALLADSVGLAVLVVLNTLNPAERLAFVLHDMFAMSFDEIAPIVGRSTDATRQLASRARRRVQGTGATRTLELDQEEIRQQRSVVEPFLAALRAGDFNALVSLLDPDLLVRTDITAPGAPREVRGAETWARGAVGYSQGARFAQPALVDGAVGLVFAPRGKLVRVVKISIVSGKIAQIEVIADPARLQQLDLAVLNE